MHKVSLVSALAVAVYVMAATPAFAQIGRGNAPVTIESDKLEFLQTEGRGIYTGNVVATQGESRITTDKLTAVCSRAAPPPGQSAIDQPCEEIRQLIAESNVIYAAPDVKIRGDRAEYDYQADTITITGDVILSRGKEGVVRGTKVVYEVAAGKTNISAGNDRVFSVLIPKSDNNRPAQPAPATPPTPPPN